MSVPASGYGNGIISTLGGLCGLAVVMGIGRFAYTALLPDMMADWGFGEDIAGAIAAWNYAGYLAGVLAVRRAKPGLSRYLGFVLLSGVSLATTAAMGLASTPLWWCALRFAGGFASGACFVLCSSIVLDTLAALRRPALAGVLYSGVGVGIALGGAAAGLLPQAGGPEAIWLALAAFCLPLTLFAAVALHPGRNLAPEVRLAAEPGVTQGADRPQRRYRILLVSYFLEGFGYIIGATFLVSLIQTTTQSPETARLAWVVTGCAAALSTPLWRYAAGKGYARMLILAFVLQGLGALLPVLSDSMVAALSAGLLLGGTFMGITVLSLQYGVTLSGRPSAQTVATMTALYGVGQIIGPLVAGSLADGQGFSMAFALAALSLFIAAALLLRLRKS
ncbi:YbfB/YjiJ family MFS transporter [Entomohabitans teleogrylli]|uniref:YbfB/YjiJ family MFS transporter n=1 Tax=Entomohabitans teleogrylli TaxID=1384589 RepID=UPI00073D200D|nr:YbfB/YjiJ family MFS transporter [Entomohabitans teleogrylli]